MNSNNCVGQTGIIEEITNGIARVNITSISACASCQLKGACGMTGSTQKQVEAAVDETKFHKGDSVTVLIEKSLGLKATLLAYVLPFVIIIAALIVFTSIGISEVISALIAIGIMASYFFLLHFYKNRLQKIFQFTLNKMN